MIFYNIVKKENKMSKVTEKQKSVQAKKESKRNSHLILYHGHVMHNLKIILSVIW